MIFLFFDDKLKKKSERFEAVILQKGEKMVNEKKERLNGNGVFIKKNNFKNWDLYLMVMPIIIYFFVFSYMPMYGVQIAFKDFNVSQGIWGSKWVGLKYFIRFFNDYQFKRLIGNTLKISFTSILFGFPTPIIFALMLNEIRNERYKRFVQTVTYAPHFISMVVMVGMIISFLSPSSGMINIFRTKLGLEPIYFMAEPKYFIMIYVLSGIWQGTGWNSIIYLSALSSIGQELHEAARVDGASRFQRLWHINIPGILPTIVIMLIMQAGNVMSVGFEKVFLLQNDVNREASDVISTYVYRMGILGGQYSFSSAVGLFNSVINVTLLLIVNKISKKLSDTSLW